MKTPHIVCLIGSVRFKEAYEFVNKQQTLLGRIVLSCGVFDHTELSDQQRHDLNELHRRKIDIADSVLVLNVGSYIGNGTRMEIEYAMRIGKTVTYLTQCGSTHGRLVCCLGGGHFGDHKDECGTEFDNNRVTAKWVSRKL